MPKLLQERHVLLKEAALPKERAQAIAHREIRSELQVCGPEKGVVPCWVVLSPYAFYGGKVTQMSSLFSATRQVREQVCLGGKVVLRLCHRTDCWKIQGRIHALQADSHLLVNQIGQCGCKNSQVMPVQTLALQSLLEEILDVGRRAIFHDSGGRRCVIGVVDRTKTVDVPTVLLHEITMERIANWRWVQSTMLVLRKGSKHGTQLRFDELELGGIGHPRELGEQCSFNRLPANLRVKERLCTRHCDQACNQEERHCWAGYMNDDRTMVEGRS